MVAMRTDDCTLAERLQWRRRTHEAAHAVVAWLCGGEVVAIEDGVCYAPTPTPIRTALVLLAGPAHDEIELAWATVDDREQPAWRADTAAIITMLGPGWEEETDGVKARRILAELTPDPGVLHERLTALARSLVACADTRFLIERVARAGVLDAAGFEAIMAPYPAIRTLYQLAAPWADLERRYGVRGT